ncbi:MAG: calcium-binding protein [Actinobacteria bacterium]|nr:calcium-binding protein [Actinomycetota bacterium]
MTINLSDNSDSDGDTLGGFEDVIGTFFADTVTGDDGPNVIFGFDDDDILSGLDGADTLVGDQGFDAGDGGLGTDRCQVEDQQNCEFGWSRLSFGRAGRSFAEAYPWRETLAKLRPDGRAWPFAASTRELGSTNARLNLLRVCTMQLWRCLRPTSSIVSLHKSPLERSEFRFNALTSLRKSSRVCGCRKLDRSRRPAARPRCRPARSRVIGSAARESQEAPPRHLVVPLLGSAKRPFQKLRS